MLSARHYFGSYLSRAGELFAGSPLVAFCLMATVLLAQAAIAGESRVALVIGNKDYKKGALVNALNDSRAMRDILLKLGFQVVYRENLKSTEIGLTLQEFKKRLEPGAVALFYYSGHGSQFRGVNYLYSINDESTNEFELPQYNMTANQVLSVMVEAKTRLNVVMLDACRDNPFKSFVRGPEDGLARMMGPVGTLISFATHPGAVAKDDGPDGHGLYTGFLLKHLNSSPNLEIERIFKLVSNEVFRYSKGAQIPWIEGVMLGDDFCFGGCRASAPSPQFPAAAMMDQNVPQPKPAAPAVQASSTGSSSAGSKPQAQGGEPRPQAQSASSKPAPPNPETNSTAQPVDMRPPRPYGSAKPQQQAPQRASSAEADIESCKQDVIEACERAAKAGNAYAQANLGWHYTSGAGVDRNLPLAAYWYRQAAEQGDFDGLRTMAQFHRYGIGVELSATQSHYWWQKAAELGDTKAQIATAENYVEGRGVEQNFGHAIYWLQKAIAQGDNSAMYELAKLYERGTQYGFDPEQAKALYSKCTELEVPACQLKEAWRLIKDGVLWSKDRKNGIALMHKVAERGYAPAQYDLGRLYADGEYLDKDVAKAVNWLRKAAQQNHLQSQLDLKRLGY